MSEDEMIVTPWQVKGKIDYDRLIKEFGTERILPDLKQRLYSIAGDTHYMLERDLFFSHRDLDWVLDEYEKGNKFVIYTGRGPSGHVHLGHMVPWIFTKWLQDKFGVRLYFMVTDDEKFVFEPNLTYSDARKFAYENILDVIAVGFDPQKTFIIQDTEHIDLMYEVGIQVAKRVTFSTARAVFGFDNSMNIGGIWYPALQAVPAFIHSWIYEKNTPCIIPCAIDQDPHWRVTRDVAGKLGYYKPASIQNRFLPGLKEEGGKMSASDPMSAIYTTDNSREARKKVMNAFTGGRATIEEQRRLGANPDICSVFKYYTFMFMPKDSDLGDIERQCRGGEILCGECKGILADYIVAFLRKHQTAREQAKERVEEFSADKLRKDVRKKKRRRRTERKKKRKSR